MAHPAQIPLTRTAANRTHSRAAWRSWVPWTLVVLATVIGLVSSLNLWVKRQALNTNSWTNASSQLLENDQIRSALSVYLVNQVYENVDVAKAIEERLPPNAKALAPPLATALEGAGVSAVDTLLERPRVQQLWREANRHAHELLMAVLDGKKGILVSSGGNVVLNLRPLVEQILAQTGLSGGRLDQALQQRLPADAGQIVIMKGNQLETARTAVEAIRVLSYFLFFLVIALDVLAVWLARGRRRKLLMGCGAGAIAVGLILLVVRRFAGDYLVNALTTSTDAKGAAGAAWAIGTQLLRSTGIMAVVYGLATMFAAWIAGPARPATWLRRVLAPTMREHPVVVFGAVALALFLLLLAGPTDGERIFPLLLLFGFAFAGTEVLRRQTAREFPPARLRIPDD